MKKQRGIKGFGAPEIGPISDYLLVVLSKVGHVCP